MRHDAVTWLDFRADDLARARDFIRSLQEEGVIDELGLPINSAFRTHAVTFCPKIS